MVKHTEEPGGRGGGGGTSAFAFTVCDFRVKQNLDLTEGNEIESKRCREEQILGFAVVHANINKHSGSTQTFSPSKYR